MTTDPWQPIETAPKEGKDILLWCKDTNEQFVGYWQPKTNGWVYALENGVRFECVPDYWMPLPEPPEAIRALKANPSPATNESQTTNGVVDNGDAEG